MAAGGAQYAVARSVGGTLVTMARGYPGGGGGVGFSVNSVLARVSRITM